MAHVDAVSAGFLCQWQVSHRVIFLQLHRPGKFTRSGYSPRQVQRSGESEFSRGPGQSCWSDHPLKQHHGEKSTDKGKNSRNGRRGLGSTTDEDGVTYEGKTGSKR